MSASPTLVPDPTVMVVQAGIFLTAIYTVNKLYLQPYLKLRGTRDDATSGLVERSNRLSETNEKLMSKIDLEIAEAKTKAKNQAKTIREEAKSRREGIVIEAEKAASLFTKAASTELTKKIAEEESKLAGKLSEITDAMLQKVLH